MKKTLGQKMRNWIAPLIIPVMFGGYGCKGCNLNPYDIDEANCPEAHGYYVRLSYLGEDKKGAMIWIGNKEKDGSRGFKNFILATDYRDENDRIDTIQLFGIKEGNPLEKIATFEELTNIYKKLKQKTKQ